jgi:hypothetical protein
MTRGAAAFLLCPRRSDSGYDIGDVFGAVFDRNYTLGGEHWTNMRTGMSCVALSERSSYARYRSLPDTFRDAWVMVIPSATTVNLAERTLSPSLIVNV